MTKTMKKLGTMLLVVAMIMTSAVCAFAAETDVMIQTEATTVNVTVPATIPIVFQADGTNLYPENWTISNNSAIANIDLMKIEMAGNDGWALLAEGTDTKALAADTKSIVFSMGKDGGALEVVDPTEGLGYDEAEVRIAASSSQVFDFGVERAAFTQAADSAKAFDMTLTFEFN